MSNAKEREREELHKTIWKIANELRGSVDGWDFKQYVLGLLFYRFISENIENYVNENQRKAGIADFQYRNISDEEALLGKSQILEEKGFFILPSELFCNIRKGADKNENLNVVISNVFNNIEASARGTASEDDVTLCISGDIFSADAAIKAMEITGAELVMVARGGLGNPTLITNINNRLEGKEELPAPTIAEQTEWALKFSEALIAEKGERVAIMELRGLIPHFFNGFPGYKKIRAEISVNIKTKEDLFRILNGILNRNRL